MALEAGDGFISGLVVTNPVGATDPKSQGDDHIRLIKTALLGTFPNLSGAVTPTQAELNILDTANTFDLNHATVDMDGTTWNADYTNIDIDAATSLTLEGGSAVITLAGTEADITATTLDLNGACDISGALHVSGASTGLGNEGISSAGDITVSKASASLYLVDSAGATNEDVFRIANITGDLFFQTRTDANASGAAFLSVFRTGTTVDEIQLDATAFDFNGTLDVDGSAHDISGTSITLSGTGETLATFVDDGAVTLYYDNSARIATSSAGASITGVLTASTGLTVTTGGINVTGSVTTPGASAAEVGYQGVPITTKTADYTIASTDDGKGFVASSACDEITLTSTSLPAGGAVVLFNGLAASADLTIVQGSGATLYLAGVGTTGNRTVSGVGGCYATAIHIGSGTFIISGPGVS